MTKAWAVCTAVVAVATLAWGGRPVTAAPLPSQSFLYQTSTADLAALAASPYAILMLDPSRDGTAAGNWTPQEIADLKAAGKIVLAVLRLGEAESSRAYWDPAWVAAETPELRPPWLGLPDPQRPGVYRVRYWQSGWQQVLMGGALGYVDRTLAQGFDGIVIEAVNAHQYWGREGKLPAAERNDNAPADMIALITQVAAYARAVAANPDFFIVPQNGATLLADASYLDLISGIVAESTWFNGEKRQKSRFTATTVPHLDRVLGADKPVFDLEYPQAEKHIDIVYDRAESKGYVPLVTTPAHDVLVLQPRHPSGAATFAAEAPPPNADVYKTVIPEFTWVDASQGTLSFRIRFSGNVAREKVFTFPKRGVLTKGSYTPTAWEWRSIINLARLNNSGAIYWWITTQSGNNVARSSRARVLYKMHMNVTTTLFWIGAEAGLAGQDSRNTSAWDADWVNHFGGVDDPVMRSAENPYWPQFTPLENPFYIALPFNDFTNAGVRRARVAKIVPWAAFAQYDPLESAVKNRWVKIVHDDTTCYAQWEDVGPVQAYDFRYVFGTAKPRNKQNYGAGVEVSPAVRDCLGLGSIGATQWRFVFDDEEVPAGPWTDVVTTSQVTPASPPPAR